MGEASGSLRFSRRLKTPLSRVNGVHDRQEPTLAGAESTPSAPPAMVTMVKRVARRGSNAGKTFWGCADYPKCRGARDL